MTIKDDDFKNFFFLDPKHGIYRINLMPVLAKNRAKLVLKTKCTYFSFRTASVTTTRGIMFIQPDIVYAQSGVIVLDLTHQLYIQCPRILQVQYTSNSSV